MTNLDSILKSWNITLPTKVHLVKAMVFSIIMIGCESWTIKKAEHRRIDAFELWCWRRLLRALFTARRSNQSILKETSPGCSLEGLMLKLKLQYFGHLMGNWLIRKDPDAGKDWRQVWVSSGSWWWTGKPGVLQSIGSQRGGHDWVTKVNWTEYYLILQSVLIFPYSSPKWSL